jgi:hypothetical protein
LCEHFFGGIIWPIGGGAERHPAVTIGLVSCAAAEPGLAKRAEQGACEYPRGGEAMLGGDPEGATQYRVVQCHKASQSEPLRVRAKERVAFERRPTAYPGWIWCTDSEGRSSWVPESWVAIKGDSCEFLRAYHAAELEVSKGEVVSGGEEAAGWVWVRNQLGEEGWVPQESLKKL